MSSENSPFASKKNVVVPDPTLAGALWRIPKWFPDLSKTELELLEKFFVHFQESAKNLNLVSLKTVPLADLIHFADAIISSRIISKLVTSPEILDLGSGAGFPGLIYAILFPKTKVILVENDKTKVEFLSKTVSKLGLKNVSIEPRSIDNLPDKMSSSAMTRGFSTISKTILFSRKFIKLGGCVYHIKGEEWPAEVGGIPTQLCSYWSPSLVSEYRLPISEVKLAVVKTEKIGD